MIFLIAVIVPIAFAQSTNWTSSTTLATPYGLATDNDTVDNGATLTVTSSLLASQLNVAPTVGKAATLTLASGGSLTLQTLLCTNVTGATAGSIFNFSGGILVTSNNNGLAANILLAANTSWNINGSWSLNGGTNIISNVATNGNASANLNIGSIANGVQVVVNPGAVLWDAIPANSASTNVSQFVIGAGIATNNQLVVNGGTVIATNSIGANAAFNLGSAAGSSGNRLIITNGGQVITRTGQNGSSSCNINFGINNGVYVGGANVAGLKAAWTFLGGERIFIGGGATFNSWLAVDSGGVISNAFIFVYNNSSCMYVTNGGLVYPSVGLIVGRSAMNNLLVVGGMDAAGNPATVSFITNKNSWLAVGGGTQTPSSPAPGTNNVARVDAGGLLTNCYAVYVGKDTNSVGNRLIITNGGQVYGLGGNGGGSYIGYVSGCNNNFVSLGGGTGVSLWDLGNHPLAIGNTLGGIAAGTNNFTTLFSGGVLTNVAAVILSGSGSLLKFNGGTLAAGTSGYLISNAPGAVSYTNYVQAGGAVINDCGYWVTNPLPMLQDPNSTGGGLTKLGSGTLALFGVNTFTGPMTISAGALVIGETGLLGNGNYSSALVNNGVFTYASTAAQTMSGVISGPGQLSINSGALLLAGINTYTGPTVISAGTLVVGGMGLLGSGNYSSALINNGVFTYASTASQILSGVISGTGSTIINSGALLLNGDASAATNLLTVNGGFFGGIGTNGGDVVMNAGSGLVPGGIGSVGTLTLTNNLTLSGSHLFFNLDPNSQATNDMVVVGNTLYLTNANSVTLAVANGIPAGNYTLMTFANGYVGTGTFALAGFTNKATLALNANSLVLQVGADGIYPDTWKGYVNGTWDTSVSNWTNSGTATHFNAGDNVLFDDTLVKSPTISNASPGAVVSPNSVTFNNNLTNYTIKANIAGTGWLTLSGSATVTLTGTNTYAGDTTINAGTLMVTNGGSINAPNATINVGAVPGSSGTLTLGTANVASDSSAITVQTLLATNVVLGGAKNSTLNFNRGTLTTFNDLGMAANILLTSNTPLVINGNWKMLGGIHYVSSVQTTGTWSTVTIGSGVANTLVTVSNAVFRTGNPVISTTNMQLIIGAGSGGGNVLNITNGGQVFVGQFTGNSGGGQGLNIGNSTGNNRNGLMVAGTNDAGRKSTLDLGAVRMYVGAAGGSSNNWCVVNGGVITNVGSANGGFYTFGVNSFVVITNGGQISLNASANFVVGRQSLTNACFVSGADAAGNPSAIRFLSTAGPVFVGGNNGVIDASYPTNNLLWVGQGGLITNAGLVYVGGQSNSILNSLVITNGGQVFSTGAGAIGASINANNNSVILGGAFGSTNALWNLGNQSLTIGNNAFASNNYATLFTGGVLTNGRAIILGGANSRLNFNGGLLVAAASGSLIATNSTTVNAANYVQAGGANINDNGFAVTLQLPLLQDPNSTGGGLTKSGNGTLTLSNVNTYIGPTLVSAGALALGGSASIASSTNIIVAGGATLDVTALSSPFTLGPGQTLSNSAVGAIINGTNDCSVGTLSLVYDGTNASFIIANGGMTLSAGTVFKLNNTGPTLARGSHQILAQGSGGVVAGMVPTNVVFTGSLLAGAPVLQLLPGGLYLNIGGQVSGINYGSTTFYYNGSAQNPGITFIGSTGEKTTNYVGVSVSYGPSINPPTNAGVYYVFNTVAADANYFNASNSTSFTIDPLALATVTAPPKVLFTTNGAIGLGSAGIPGNEYVLERSTNLINWMPLLLTNLPAGGLINFVDDFIDRGGVKPDYAFYRLLPYNNFNVRDYGAQGDGVALDTGAIQDAINAANTAGGGTVYLPAGAYKTVELILKNNVTLNIAQGATVAASTNSSDWSSCKQSPVIFAENMTNLAICGSGTIDGGGLVYYNRSGTLDGNIRPDSIIVLGNCQNVNVSGVSLVNSVNWTQKYIQCDYLTVNGVIVRNREFALNNWTDGIDVCGGRYVTLENLDIETGDDGICLKPQGDPYQNPARPTHDVTISYCTVASTCNATKIGTATTDLAYNIFFDHITVNRHSKITQTNNPIPSGSCIAAISLQSNDGGTNHDYIFQNYTITDCDTPIFVEVQNRQSVVPHANNSQLYNATISDIVCSHSTRASQINVEPGCSMRNITFCNLTIHNQETNYVTTSPAYLNGGYPEANNYGRMPAYGLFARYVSNLTFTGTNTFYDDGNSGRPATQYENMGAVVIIPP